MSKSDYDRYTKRGGETFVADARAVLEQARGGEEAQKCLLQKARDAGYVVMHDEIVIGVDLANGPDTASFGVITGTKPVYDLDSNLVMPQGAGPRRVGKAPELGMPYGQRTDKPSLSIAYVPQYLGDIHNGYKIKVSGPSGDMLYGGGFGWSTEAEAEKHSLAACGEYWRRHG